MVVVGARAVLVIMTAVAVAMRSMPMAGVIPMPSPAAPNRGISALSQRTLHWSLIPHF